MRAQRADEWSRWKFLGGLPLTGMVGLVSILLIAIAIRSYIAVNDKMLLWDSMQRYHPLASNLLAGHGFSQDLVPPHRPASFDQPGYPTFLALVYAVTAGSIRGVVLAQLFLELLILFAVAWIVRELGMPRRVQMTAVAIGLVCPFLVRYAGFIMSEILATLAITLACYAFIRAVKSASKNKLMWWGLAGVSSGASLLVRGDMAVTVAPMFLVAVALTRSDSLRQRGPQAAMFLLTIMVILAPWSFRNYVQFGDFRPLGGVAGQTGYGYVEWLNTWLDSPKYIGPYWWQIQQRNREPPPFPSDKIHNADERLRAQNALMLARSQRTFKGEAAKEYQLLAAEALQRRPVQTLIVVPIKRLLKTWFNPPVDRVSTLLRFALYGLWLALLGCALLGFLFALQLRLYIILLPLAVVLGRSLLPLISSLGADQRYLVEALPACYVLAALGISAGRAYCGFSKPSLVKLDTDLKIG